MAEFDNEDCNVSISDLNETNSLNLSENIQQKDNQDDSQQEPEYSLT